MVRLAMDEARTETGNLEGRAFGRFDSASQAAWERYYKEASRRRRARGGLRENHQKEKRRRRRIEYLGIVLSSGLLTVLTFVFYRLLSR
jgi:hypothetical protein